MTNMARPPTIWTAGESDPAAVPAGTAAPALADATGVSLTPTERSRAITSALAAATAAAQAANASASRFAAAAFFAAAALFAAAAGGLIRCWPGRAAAADATAGTGPAASATAARPMITAVVPQRRQIALMTVAVP
jgi:hypothetical protein